MTEPYRNFQLLTTGNLFGKTVVTDPNYDASYEVFRVYFFGLNPSLNNAVYGLWFNNQNDPFRYTNLTSANNNYIILNDDVTNKVTAFFSADLTVFWPATGGSPAVVTVMGYSTYVSGASLIRYQIGAIASIDAAGGGLPSPFLSMTDIANSSKISNNAARYINYGISGFGAATI